MWVFITNNHRSIAVVYVHKSTFDRIWWAILSESMVGPNLQNNNSKSSTSWMCVFVYQHLTHKLMTWKTYCGWPIQYNLATSDIGIGYHNQKLLCWQHWCLCPFIISVHWLLLDLRTCRWQAYSSGHVMHFRMRLKLCRYLYTMITAMKP